MKKPSECVKYCIKDGDYVEHNCNAKKMAEGKSGVMTLIYADLKEGKSFRYLVDTYGSTAGQNKRKLEEMIGYYAKINREKELLPWTTVRSSTIESRPIAKWLNESIKNREFKPRKDDYRMLYLSGPPGIGKTSMIETLSTRLRVYQIPSDEDFYDEWNDGDYDVAILGLS